jgi:hypothetical protein
MMVGARAGCAGEGQTLFRKVISMTISFNRVDPTEGSETALRVKCVSSDLKDRGLFHCPGSWISRFSNNMVMAVL